MYYPISIWKKIAGVITWIFLLLLIPLSALGYFAEKTVPGNSLYPAKRTIEKLVLAVEFFDKSNQSLYQVNLADKRFNEAETLLENSNIKQLSILPLKDMTVQIDSAKESINAVSNPTEKKKAIEILLNNIHSYQNKLGHIQTTYQVPNIPVPVQQNSQQIIQQHLILQNIPSPQPQLDQQTVNTVYQVQNTLQQDQTALQKADDNINNGGDGIIPTSIPTPTPTPLPSTGSPSPTGSGSPTSVPTSSSISGSSPTPVSVNSCQTYCQSKQYNTGSCEQNANKCSKNNQTYESGGDQYCPGGPQKACCCS